MNLPESFKERMKAVLGDSYDAFIASFDAPSRKGIRLSRSKLTEDDYDMILSDLGQEHHNVPWISCGFYYEGETSGKDPYYHAGVYYPQEPSAMLPAEVLAAKPGEYILDLCAAPGGKACRIGEDLKGEGLLVANEINAERSKALNRNIERSGITNCVILNESPDRIAAKLPGFFDKVLIDAPCSGEGMFRRDPRAVKSWESYGPDSISGLQFEIISYAARMLRPGGEIVYSTCTFAEVEDELLISRFLEENKDFEIVPHPEINGITHIEEGPAKGAMRIWPHISDGDGHFCVHLRNTSDSAAIDYDRQPNPATGNTAARRIDMITSFLEGFATPEYVSCIREKCNSELMINGNGLYLMPVNYSLFNKLKIIKSGLFLGEVKETRTERIFVPSNSFPLTLDRESVRSDSFVSYSRDDIELEKYLKGETVFLNYEQKGIIKNNGIVVIGVNGFPLGLGKVSSGTVKNMYPKAWRLL